jgi:hypothetical protein
VEGESARRREATRDGEDLDVDQRWQAANRGRQLRAHQVVGKLAAVMVLAARDQGDRGIRSREDLRTGNRPEVARKAGEIRRETDEVAHLVEEDRQQVVLAGSRRTGCGPEGVGTDYL